MVTSAADEQGRCGSGSSSGCRLSSGALLEAIHCKSNYWYWLNCGRRAAQTCCCWLRRRQRRQSRGSWSRKRRKRWRRHRRGRMMMRRSSRKRRRMMMRRQQWPWMLERHTLTAHSGPLWCMRVLKLTTFTVALSAAAAAAEETCAHKWDWKMKASHLRFEFTFPVFSVFMSAGHESELPGKFTNPLYFFCLLHFSNRSLWHLGSWDCVGRN